MDKRLRILLHLYGEDGDPSELRSLLEDDALRGEYEALSEVKGRLDDRCPERPDPEVLDRVVAAARTDRETRPLRLVRFSTVGALAAMFALLLAIGLVWKEGVFEETFEAPQTARQGTAVPQADTFAEDEATAAREAAPTLEEEEAAKPLTAFSAPPPAPAPPEADASARRDVGAAARTLAAPEPVAADADAAEEAVPAWDEADELLRLHRRLEMLEARSQPLAWDDSSVISLDVLPTDQPGAPRGLDAVSTKKHQ